MTTLLHKRDLLSPFFHQNCSASETAKRFVIFPSLLDDGKGWSNEESFVWHAEKRRFQSYFSWGVSHVLQCCSLQQVQRSPSNSRFIQTSSWPCLVRITMGFLVFALLSALIIYDCEICSCCIQQWTLQSSCDGQSILLEFLLPIRHPA